MRLDIFLHEKLGEKAEFKDLWKVVKILLILSHGQSSKERGFSENKDILDNNMTKDCLVAYCRAHDGIKSMDCGIKETVMKEVFDSCRHACSRYSAYLDEKAKQTSEKSKGKSVYKMKSVV